MKISYRWLGRHVDLAGLSPQDVADDLTIHTAEVEGLAPFAPWLADVVVGHVVERRKHPDADKLSLCKVDVGPRGEGQLLQIVCGAPNVAQGQRVAVALPGVTLPGELRIKKSKIRGVESQGMICSERELALSDEHVGIWVLDPAQSPAQSGALEPGTPVGPALGLDDWVIEIDNKSLTHRPDLWGQRGLAREIAAIRKRALAPLELAWPKTGPGPAYPVAVESAGCARYLGLVLENVQNGPSPAWMRALLLAVGQRPLDLLVDLSNFVMLDLAQPNHLFDLTRLSPAGIRVRDARAGESTRTLDGVERALQPEDMLICSGDEVVAIAGVMGGEASKVTPETRALLLEAASFHPTRVRRTAARLAVRTDASARFEKNLDPTLPAKAAAHLVNLLRALQPNVTLPRAAGDAGQWRDPACRVGLRPERVRAVLGAPLADSEIEGYLTGLGFGVERGSPWSIAVPSERATKDIRIEEDLIEEVGRLHGYGNIVDMPLVAPLVPAPRDEVSDKRELVRALQDRLSGAAGFHEAMTYSFHEAAAAQLLGIADEPHVRIVNPQIEGLDRVRRSVAPSLLARLAHNRRQSAEVRLFEIGKGYEPERSNERGEPRERHECALVWLAPRAPKGARFDASVFAQLQGVVEDALEAVGRPVAAWQRCVPSEIDRWGMSTWAHPGRAVVSDHAGSPKPIAWMAALEPEVQARLGLVGELDGEVAVARIDIDHLLAVPAEKTRFRPLPRFPSVKVDVAVAVPESSPAGSIAAALEAAGKGLVESCELFDLYRGPNLGPGKKSLAFHVLLQADDRTLSDQDCAKYLARVERALTELGGELRKE